MTFGLASNVHLCIKPCFVKGHSMVQYTVFTSVKGFFSLTYHLTVKHGQFLWLPTYILPLKSKQLDSLEMPRYRAFKINVNAVHKSAILKVKERIYYR